MQPDGKLIVVGTDSNAGSQSTIFTARYFATFATTTALGTISGRVLSPNGRGVPRAVVHVTDQDGNVRTARTNPFGYYRFEDIEVGQSLIFDVYNKQYQFDSQIVNLEDSITGLNFTAQSSSK